MWMPACEYFYVCKRENVCTVLCNDRQSYMGHHNHSSWNNWLSCISCSQRMTLDIFSALSYVDILGRSWKQHSKDFYYFLVEIYERPHEVYSRGLVIATDFVWKTQGFFSCFLISLPITGVTYNVIQFLQYVIWIFIVMMIFHLNKNILSPKKRNLKT